MPKLNPREAALLRMALHDESLLLKKDMTNTSPDIGAEFPRMLYRATDEEEEVVVSTDKNGKPNEFAILNKYNGLLCDTVVANDIDEAEALATQGWDISPEAAHGVTSGLAAVASAKDAEIAALRAQLAARDEVEEPETKRRGRPPKAIADTDETV